MDVCNLKWSIEIQKSRCQITRSFMHNLLSAQQDTEKAISERAILLNEDNEFKLFSTNQN
jgi:hypothetical protein